MQYTCIATDHKFSLTDQFPQTPEVRLPRSIDQGTRKPLGYSLGLDPIPMIPDHNHLETAL
jgi:hypothetical protein